MKKYIKYLLAICIVFTAFSVSAVEFGDISMGSNVEIHGFISQGYMQSSHNNFFGETDDGTAEFSEVGFNLGTDLGDNLRLGIQIFSRKLGEFGKGEVEIDWAYGDYRYKDWLGIRAGKMKLPHGLHNTTRDIDFLRTNIFLPQSVYNEAWRDSVAAIQGGEVYGDIYLGKAGNFSYQFQGGICEFDVDSGVVTTTKDQLKLKGMDFDIKDSTSHYGAATGLVWSAPVDGLKFSLTGWVVNFTLKGETTVGSDETLKFEMETKSRQWTGSIQYEIGDFIISGEYSRNYYDFWSEADKIGNFHDKLETEGYYGAVSYRFTDWMEIGTYYSVYYADIDDKNGKANKTGSRKNAGYNDYDSWLKDLCLSVKFDISENWVLKFEGHKMDGAAILMKDINTVNNKLQTEEDWYLGAAKLTFSF